MRMDYAKILESLKGLISENTSPEEAEKISGVVKEVEQAKQEHEDTLIKHEELRQKYIKALQNSAFSETPKEDPPEKKPMTFEECVEKVIAQRKDK